MAEKFDFQNPRPLPEDYPLFDVDPVSAVFSTARGHIHNGGMYLSYHEGQCKLVPREWQDKASSLFFRGGSLEGLGLRPRADLGDDAAPRIRMALRLLLGSFEPKHEEKEATVGFALMKWCEPSSATQAEAA